jgi:hypothetical protein
MGPRVRAAPTLGLLLALAGCPSLGEIQLGVCGNGVVESDLGEECDTPQEGSAETKEPDGRTVRCAGPGEAGACHFVWSAGVCCPAGASPGIDGRCRFDSLAFDDTAAVTLTRSADRALSTDVDGDGWGDLVLEHDNDVVEVVFFGRGGAVRGTIELQREGGSRTAVGHLGDTRDASAACAAERSPGAGALLLPSSSGVRILLGREGPEILSKVNAAFDPQQEARALPMPSGACVPPIDVGTVVPPDLDCPALLTEDDGGLSVYVVLLGLDLPDVPTEDPKDDPQGPPVRRHFFEGVGFDDLAAPPQIVRLPGWRGCDGVAFWFRRGDADGDGVVDEGASFESRLEVVGFCASSYFEAFRGEQLARIDLAPGETPFVFDATGDGAVDLVIGSEEEIRIHPGDGAGSFAEAPVTSFATPQVPGASDPPLALAMLDGDDRVDVVHGYAVFLSGGRCGSDPVGAGGGGAGAGGGGGAEEGGADEGGAGEGAGGGGSSAGGCDYRLAAVQSPDDNAVWTEIATGDLNGDGRTDVAATRVSVAGGDNHAIDLLLSGLSTMYTPVSIATDRPPEKLVAEDFDGDAIVDVAYVLPTEAATCALGDDEVYVVFGGAHPSEPVRVAELAGIDNIASAPLLFEPDTFDGAADIGIATSCPEDDDGLAYTAAVLLGSTDRRLRSPYPFNGAADAGRALLATVDLTGGADDHPDLLGVAPRRAQASGGGEGPHVVLEEIGVWAFAATGDADLPGSRDDLGVGLGTFVPTVTHDPRQAGSPGAPQSRLLQRAALVTGELDGEGSPCTPGQEGSPPCAAAEGALFLSSEQDGSDAGAPQRGVPRLYVLRGADVAYEVAPADPSACAPLGAEQIAEEEEVDVDVGVLDRAYTLTDKSTEAALADLDGDGREDVVGWWRGPLDAAEPTSAVGGAAIFWNGEGGFGGRCAAPLPLPEGEVVRRIAPLDDPSGSPAIVIATDRAVRLLRPGGRDRLDACAAADEARCPTIVPAGGAPIRDVAVVDVDQDGLQDLAVVREGGVELVTQRARDEVASR